MPAAPPPPPWASPVSPVVVARPFREVAPYRPGGHRGIDLRTSAGTAVRAPCDGQVTFRGRVATGPPTVTIDCGDLRATLQRVAGSIGAGGRVARGTVVGMSTAAVVDLSARRPDGTYRDPLGLLGAAAPRVPPVVGALRPARDPHPRRASLVGRPAHLPARALVAPATDAAVPGGRAAAGGEDADPRATAQSRAASPGAIPGPDRPLLMAGAGALGIALAALVAGRPTSRRRRVRPMAARGRTRLAAVRR